MAAAVEAAGVDRTIGRSGDRRRRWEQPEHKPRKSEKEKKRSKLSKKKRRREKENEADADNKFTDMDEEHVDKLDQHKPKKSEKEKEKSKLSKKKKRRAKENEADADNKFTNMDEEHGDELYSNGTVGNFSSQIIAQSEIDNSAQLSKENIGKKNKTKKVTKAGKSKRKNERKDLPVVATETKLKGNLEDNAEQADEISSVDHDCSRGMKKWLIEYKESRPGLKILQQRIDEFITGYEAQQEQERKEREARAAEGGWTVVTHHKGRKKTTDPESGVTVGSVAPAAVMDNMAKKKTKEVALDFYRFQRREAQRNEVMMLQSKFEQDKKRIQQLRAARKFRPY